MARCEGERAEDLARTESSLGPDAAWFANTQSFHWDGGRSPTGDEARNMNAVALVHGAKGIVMYSFAEGSTTIAADAPQLWAELVREASEMPAIDAYLLDGQRTLLSSEAGTESAPGGVHAAYWSTPARGLLVVANTASAGRDVDLLMPKSAKGPLVAAFPNRPFGLSLQASEVTGHVGPREVHVYFVGDPPLDGGAPQDATARVPDAGAADTGATDGGVPDGGATADGTSGYAPETGTASSCSCAVAGRDSAKGTALVAFLAFAGLACGRRARRRG